MNLQGKKILLTGGSSGIGRETARKCIEQGATVVITGRNEKKLQSVAKEIGAIPLHFDISNLETIPSKAKEALELLGGELDVLINNAGIGLFRPLGEITEAHLMQVYQTNVFGLILLTQELIPSFKAQNHGNIINIGSTASLKGYAQGTVYASSKFAVRGITQSWQAELRPHNIRVCLINPSEVTTAFNSEARDERTEDNKKLGSEDIAHTIVSVLEMRDKGFVPEVTIWATNPF